MKKLLFLLLVTSISFSQTHTFPALDTPNTWSGSNDFSNVPLMRLRVSAALTTSVTGDCGFDTTASNWHCWNGVDAIIPLVPVSALPGNASVAQFVVSSGQVTLAGSSNALPLSISSVSHNFLKSYNSSTGLFTQAQPACADLSNVAPSCSTDATVAAGASGSGTYDFTGATSVKLPPMNTVSFISQSAPANPPSGDFLLYGNSSTGNLTCLNSSGGSCFSSTASPPLVSTSANPAASGIVRVASGDTPVAFRNNANTADVAGLTKDTSDVVQVGGSAGMKINGGSALTTSNQSGTGSICMTTSCSMTTPNIGSASASSVTTTASSPAQSGVYRCSGNQGCVIARTPDNTTDVQLGYTLNGPVAVFGSVGGSTSGVTAEVGKLQVDQSVNQSAGIQHTSVTSCTTPSGTSGTCNTTLTWPVTWADSGYTTVCTIGGIFSGGSVAIVSVTNTTTTSTIQIENSGSNTSASQVVLNCIGMH